ncbi:Hypothetical protein MVR_LOCUS5 [uncultured virus]|nr:Hypothetical protein MVR_LOCUS5 [uncultured virus]
MYAIEVLQVGEVESGDGCACVDVGIDLVQLNILVKLAMNSKSLESLVLVLINWSMNTVMINWIIL